MIAVKLGGSILDQDIKHIVQDVKDLRERNEKLIIVHGGAKKVTDIAERMGKEQKFVTSVSGFRSRYTDKETAEIYTMVIGGLLNKQIVASLIREGIPSVGLTGIDGVIFKAERKEKIKVKEGGKVFIIDGDYTGKVVEVNKELVSSLINAGYVPVIGSVAVSEKGEFLNIDGDRAAASLAGAIGCDVLVFLTDVPGVMEEGRVLEKLSMEEAENLMEKIEGGMKRKVFAALEAMRAGVRKTIIASGLRPQPITEALREKGCTVIEK